MTHRLRIYIYIYIIYKAGKVSDHLVAEKKQAFIRMAYVLKRHVFLSHVKRPVFVSHFDDALRFVSFLVFF